MDEVLEKRKEKKKKKARIEIFRAISFHSRSDRRYVHMHKRDSLVKDACRRDERRKKKKKKKKKRNGTERNGLT